MRARQREQRARFTRGEGQAESKWFDTSERRVAAHVGCLARALGRMIDMRDTGDGESERCFFG